MASLWGSLFQKIFIFRMNERNLKASDETVIFQSHDCACQIIFKIGRFWPLSRSLIIILSYKSLTKKKTNPKMPRFVELELSRLFLEN